MSVFKTTSLDKKLLDPLKRVNYTMGLVLGVDEFQQEQFYLLERDRLHQRALHGYGAVYGLRVFPRRSGETLEVVVEAGLAVDPQGQSICVPLAQCADLNAWLSRHAGEVRDRFGSPPASQLSLYAVLCYRECATDLVPVPGGPCRSQEDASAASRIKDDFMLELRLDPPEQCEEDVVRAFGELLRRVAITDEPGDFLTEEELLQLVRDLPERLEAGEEGSPPESGSPPSGGSPPDVELLRLHPSVAAEYLSAAFRVWVTEVRPTVIEGCDDEGASVGGDGCWSPVHAEGCVLLAELRFGIVDDGSELTVDDSGGDADAEILILEGERPYLLHTRLLQEWLASGPFAGGGAGGEVVVDHGALFGLGDDDHPQYLTRGRGDARYALLGHTHELNDLDDVNASPTDGQVLTWDDGAGEWIADDVEVETIEHAALEGLEEDDHEQYLLADGTRALAGDWSAGSFRITNLADGTDPADAVRVDQAVKVGDAPESGDLGDTYPNPTVIGLQGNAVAASDPAEGDTLVWNDADGEWQPGRQNLDDLSDVNAPNPPEGSVLTRRGSAWLAETSAADGNFVRANAGPYEIVAAGYFEYQPDGSLASQGPVYGPGFTARRDLGDILLHWDTYVPPGEEHLYIVKGTTDMTSSRADQQPVRTTFHFVEFGEEGEGIRIRIVDDDLEAPIEQLVGFMIEISLLGEVSAEPSRLDLNRATREELTALPNIGPALATRIIEAREERGGFTSLDELTEINGITADRLERLRPLVTVTPQ